MDAGFDCICSNVWLCMTFREDSPDYPDRGSVVGTNVHLVRGRGPILKMQEVLSDFSECCGQPGAFDDVPYFLSKPGIFTRTPYLLLVSKSATLNMEDIAPDMLLGAVLVYRNTKLGIGLGLYTTNDRSGWATVLAPVEMRAWIASRASLWLLDQGALAVMISYRGGLPENGNGFAEDAKDGRKLRWIRREREVMEYLPLASTYDATLARIGQRTRKNLRYYRRLAEAQLGCTFVPNVTISKAEFLDYNRECMYAVSAKIAALRYDLLKELASPLLMGIKDGNGRWLSLLGTRRLRNGTEILWQMNREGLPSYSLSIVMRSYCLEHEIEHGVPRLYVAGGTPHPIGRSFLRGKITDLVVLRRSVLGSLLPHLAKYLVTYDNGLAVALVDQNLEWRSSKQELLAFPSTSLSI